MLEVALGDRMPGAVGLGERVATTLGDGVTVGRAVAVGGCVAVAVTGLGDGLGCTVGGADAAGVGGGAVGVAGADAQAASSGDANAPAATARSALTNERRYNLTSEGWSRSGSTGADRQWHERRLQNEPQRFRLRLALRQDGCADYSTAAPRRKPRHCGVTGPSRQDCHPVTAFAVCRRHQSLKTRSRSTSAA